VIGNCGDGETCILCLCDRVSVGDDPDPDGPEPEPGQVHELSLGWECVLHTATVGSGSEPHYLEILTIPAFQ
jgi:hypothetical protein